MVLLSLLCPLFAYGQDLFPDSDSLPDNILQYLEENAINVHIEARVTSPGQSQVWRTESRNVTISGRAVEVKLTGENVIIFADIIPYVNQDRTILLVAKGEVWTQADPAAGVKYYSTMKSLPVRPGESVIFFPLGRAMDQEQNVYNIELEISVILYTP